MGGESSHETPASPMMSHWLETQQKQTPYIWLALSTAHPLSPRRSQLSLQCRSLRELDKVKALPARKNRELPEMQKAHSCTCCPDVVLVSTGTTGRQLAGIQGPVSICHHLPLLSSCSAKNLAQNEQPGWSPVRGSWCLISPPPGSTCHNGCTLSLPSP